LHLGLGVVLGIGFSACSGLQLLCILNTLIFPFTLSFDVILDLNFSPCSLLQLLCVLNIFIFPFFFRLAFHCCFQSVVCVALGLLATNNRPMLLNDGWGLCFRWRLERCYFIGMVTMIWWGRMTKVESDRCVLLVLWGVFGPKA
jgi:hypothetical protein